MFQTMQMAPPDAILGLTEAFKKDTNPNKINLSVGVYQDSSGKTPILAVVKEAEKRLLSDELNKSYLGIDGLPEYGVQVRTMLFGENHPIISGRRAVTAQTPGGTGALRVAADFLKQKLGASRIWCSKPTWANHPSVFQAAGLEVDTYPYLDQAGTGLDYEAMIAGLKKIPAGDAICLHACCHNPTGVDPTTNQWREIGQILQQQGVLPLVDFAYQGFAEGLEEDAGGLRMMAEQCPEMLVCSSFSKNFGLYGERVGAMTAVTETEEAAQIVLSNVKTCIRTNYSNPPKHGGAIVATVLGDAQLRAKWVVELAEMRESYPEDAPAVRRYLEGQGSRSRFFIHPATARHVLLLGIDARSRRCAAERVFDLYRRQRPYQCRGHDRGKHGHAVRGDQGRPVRSAVNRSCQAFRRFAR